KPPPPMLPAKGYVTASAKPVATAASTALPPRAMMSRPTRLAMESLLATIACGANDACAPGRNRHDAGKVAATRAGDVVAGVARVVEDPHAAAPMRVTAQRARAVVVCMTVDRRVRDFIDVVWPRRRWRSGDAALRSSRW